MEPIIVTQAEFYAKDNAKTNKTEEFDLLDNPEAISPILRRGCNFYFSIRFDRNFDAKLDAVRIEFSIGNVQNLILFSKNIYSDYVNSIEQVTNRTS